MNDTDLAALVHDAMRDTQMTVPESDITRRARRLRTRRRVAAGGGMTVGLAAAALAVATLAAPASSPATGQAQNTAQLTAWTVTKDPDGVIDVTIRELKDPAGLQARLRADGVPAIVRFSFNTNTACDYYPDGLFIPAGYLLSFGRYVKPGNPWIHSYDNGSVTVVLTGQGDLTLVLRPARLPRGSAFEIFAPPHFGHAVGLGLVKTSPACAGLCRITGEDEHAGGAADLPDPSAMPFMPWMQASPSWPPCGFTGSRPPSSIGLTGGDAHLGQRHDVPVVIAGHRVLAGTAALRGGGDHRRPPEQVTGAIE